MDTIARVMQLADERNLSLFKLSQLCDVSYSTLKNAEMRGSQLGVPTIERICVALGVTLSDFFAESDSAYTKCKTKRSIGRISDGPLRNSLTARTYHQSR